MPFREPFNTYYEGVFEPAVRNVNLEPLRGDSLFRPTPIMGDIWKMIQGAKVLLAELTTKNANVFYELGLAHAIGKPIALVAETMDDVPFDLQPLRVILYDKNNPEWGAKLQETITESLRETMKDPIEAVPAMYRKLVKSQAPEDSEVNLRLEALERMIRPLRESPPLSQKAFPSNHSRRLQKFIDALKNANSREDALKATDFALSDKLPTRLIRKYLDRLLPSSETKIILNHFGIKSV